MARLRMSKAEYAEYLQGEHWQMMRRLALKDSDGRCRVCDSDDMCDVHHRSYDRIGREELSDLVVLCRSHHEMFHGLSGEEGVAGKSYQGRRCLWADPDLAAVHCPMCRGENVHLSAVEVNAGGQITTITSRGMEQSRSEAFGRGVRVRIRYSCECEHIFQWVLWFCKGMTLTDTEQIGPGFEGVIWRD